MVKVSNPAIIDGPVYVPGLPREHMAEKYGIPLEDFAKLGSAESGS